MVAAATPCPVQALPVDTYPLLNLSPYCDTAALMGCCEQITVLGHWACWVSESRRRAVTDQLSRGLPSSRRIATTPGLGGLAGTPDGQLEPSGTQRSCSKR